MTGSRVARASLWAIAGGGGQYLITFLLLVYLAHSLNPRDFGLMATVTIGLDLGMQIARWGQVELLQQSRYRSDDARNQAMRVSVAIASIFAAIFATIAKPLAEYYASPELAWMFWLCAPVFVLSSLSATAEGILRSEFRFRLLAYRGTMTAAVGGVVAVGLVALGYNGIALAAQRLVQALIAVVWVWSSVSWRPSFGRTIRYSRELLRDGASLMTGMILPLIVPRAIDLFVSVTLGPAPLGLLRIAFRIFEFVGQMVIMPLVGVATAQLSQFPGDVAGMRRSYLRFTQVSAALICPLMIGFALVAPEAVPILFGPQWLSSVPLVQMVSILALTAPPNYFYPSAMVALGKSQLVLKQGAFQVVVGLLLAGFAAQYSLTAVLIAQIVRGIVLSAYNAVDLRRHMMLSFREMLRCMTPPYVATAVMAVAMGGARYGLVGHTSPLAMMLAMITVGSVAYTLAILLGVRLRIWPDFLLIFSRWMPKRLQRVLLI
ncbi:oligosaccharide flippase family protein [Sphingomonas sp.]|uniref:oligosaccharide flippase family protein n=1 Tax=Sphingomonas sp. TaxID=28214 RepID=UPI0025E0929B|nr:oligosaccharide flippase family protein [Sphingomonas sp.]